MKREKKEGFTLIELLATILIISIILGIVVQYSINILNNTDEKSISVAINNIKSTARIYVEENPNKITWINNTNEEKTQIACISTKNLINNGYLTEKDFQENGLEEEKYILITKDTSNNTILSEDFDSETCSNNFQIIEIPTNQNSCNELEYNGENQQLTINNTDDITFTNNFATNAGTYTIIASLNTTGATEETTEDEEETTEDEEEATEDEEEATEQIEKKKIWNDGTTEDKSIKCSIKKATPTLELSPDGNESSAIGTYETNLISNVNGTITIKSSNKKYATATPSNGTNEIVKNNNEKETKNEEEITEEIENSEETTEDEEETTEETENPEEIIEEESTTEEIKNNIKVTTLASRTTETYITITVTPTGDDALNYTQGEITYTIGKAEKVAVDYPTCISGEIAGNGTSNVTLAVVTKTEDGQSPYTLENNVQKEIGTHTITAKLKYGYYWKESNSTEDYKFKCKIIKDNTTHKVTIYYATAGGDVTKATTYKNQKKYWQKTSENIIQYSTDNKTYKDYKSTIKYKSTLGTAGLPNYNNKSALNITRTNYTAAANKEWKCISGDCKGKTYNQNTIYSSDDFCNAKNEDCTVTLAVNWTINKLKINYSTNNKNATIKTPNTYNDTKYTFKKATNGLLTITPNNNKDVKTTFTATEKVELQNPKGNILKISRSGYVPKPKNEWICLSGCKTKTTFSIDSTYDTTKFCNTGSSSCTVTLGVNWEDEPTCTIKKNSTASVNSATVTVSCTDKNAGCKKICTGTNTDCKNTSSRKITYKDQKTNTTKTYEYTIYDKANVSKTCKVSITTATRYRKKTKSSGYYTTSSYTCYTKKQANLGTLSDSFYRCNQIGGTMGSTGICTYYVASTCYKSVWHEASWSSWSGYTYKSCTPNSTTQCEKATIYS